MEKIIDNIVVVKVGTTTLTKQNENGTESLDAESFSRIGKQVTALRNEGRHALLVSSGAISAGIHATGQQSRAEADYSMTDLQRLASIGWRHVLNAWAESVDGMDVGEVLLTRRELGRRSEGKEALSVIHGLMSNNGLAVVNENDAISHEEIAFGDNDTLAARLASKIARSALFGSDVKLVMLSDVDGVYKDVDDRSSLISCIDDMSTFAAVAGGSGSASGTGGMRTKFDAANIAMKSNVDTWIANGREENAVSRAINGEIGTHISADIHGERMVYATSHTGLVS